MQHEFELGTLKKLLIHFLWFRGTYLKIEV